MNKNVLKSLFIVFAILTASIGATGSYFSDQVSVVDNQFSAGYWGNVVINEVYYDPDALHQGPGQESHYEWIELYNPNSFTVNLQNWTIADNSDAVTIHANKSIPAGGFALVSKSANIWNSYWGINPGNPGSSIEIIELGQIIGSGLSNNGDRVILKNSSGDTIDQMSYGTDTTIFNPACSDIVEGHSLERDPNGTDTDIAVDFVDKTAPTPGS